jgi:hypothetical protein
VLQVPPAVASLKVVDVPWHTDVAPFIGNIAFTVTTVVALHPAPIAYVIVVVPVATPVTVPLVRPIVPIAVLLLVHVPPVTTSLSVTDAPAHIGHHNLWQVDN